MDPLLILHGAIGSAGQLKMLARELSSSYSIHNINFPGHGGTETNDDFSIEFFAEHVKQYCQENNLHSINIFGYSMGGYVALYMALKQPAMVNKILTLATKFAWDPEVAARESSMLDAETIENKVPKFAELLKQRHAPVDWKQVLQKTSSMLESLGRQPRLKDEDLRSINQPVLLMLGDRDKMVSMEETIHAYKQLPNAQLAVLPSTPHPIEQSDLALIRFFTRNFLD